MLLDRGLPPGPNMAVYFATKAYVLSFTEALHEELKPHGIKASALCPGPTKTESAPFAGFEDNGSFDRICDGRSKRRQGRLAGLDRNKAVVVPGLSTRSRGVDAIYAAAIVRKIAVCIEILMERAPNRAAGTAARAEG